MPNLIANLFESFQEWKGRLIAYGGGTSVSVFSNEVAAKAQQAAETAASSPEITTANLISLGGLLVIAGRLVFDIYVHFDKKRQKREVS
ncbi:hypothetical protein NAL94_23825 (plasmid) [Vibrio alginolyticus]|uniref:hypothetical protein n=1 Tax=Vibrio TaxID=662 RepID=UPI0014822DA8|nr:MULTISPECIES: hypothetical protein [Vibrio]EGQ7740908.1 hypothetical protein [Vibrio parahaemolyticus]EJG1399008.1 hypothetical protein [Vibrio parahaemolyticus]MDF5393015.1 hypothetical protein [Vibrio parahaemolyticus]MDF5398959.1 hypothetical protein [Vibrio parahaemolyticus]MDW1981976.1 hypothetical protein [Vibrio sp. Vb0304]